MKWNACSKCKSIKIAGISVQSISEAAACAGRLEAPGKETAEWLTGGCGGLNPAQRCALGVETPPEGVQQSMADIEAVAARVESAFAAIRAFEDAHPTDFRVRCLGGLQAFWL